MGHHGPLQGELIFTTRVMQHDKNNGELQSQFREGKFLYIPFCILYNF